MPARLVPHQPNLPNNEIELAQLSPGVFKLVRIIARLNVGGPAQHVVHLADGLRHEYPTLVVFGSVADGEAEMLEHLPAGRVTYLRIPELGRRVRPGSDLIALLKLIRVLARARPDIVCTHTAKAGVLGRIAAFLVRVPVRIHTFHGHVFDGYFSPAVSKVVVGVERALAAITTRIFAISDEQKHDLAQRFRVCAPEKIDVVPLGIDLDPFGRAVAADGARIRTELRAGGRKVITAVGRLAPIKDHSLLLDAFARLGRNDVVLAIVGDGTERVHLQQRAQQLGIAERVRFLGWRSDLAPIYAASDLVVLTSRNEGTPVCLIESLAAGIPVVATDVGGVRSVLGNGQYGTLVPPGNADALAAAINQQLDEPPNAQSLAEASASVFARYSVERLLRDAAERYHLTRTQARENELSDYGWRRLRRLTPRRSAAVTR